LLPPELHQQLDPAQRLQRRAPRGPVDDVDTAVPSTDLRRGHVHPAHRSVPAQRQGNLPGQLDGVVVRPQQQPAGEQPAHRALRIGAGTAATDRRTRGQRVQHPPFLLVDLGQQLGQHRGTG